MAIVGGHDAAAGAYPVGRRGSPRQELSLHRHADRAGLGDDRRPLRLDHRQRRGDADRLPAGADRRLHRVQPGPARASWCRCSQAIVSPDYIATQGYDVTLLQARRARRAHAPTLVAGAGETSAWAPGIAGDDRRLGRDLRGRRHAGHAPGGPGPGDHRRLLRGRLQRVRRARRCSAPATPRAASTRARATRAARCSARPRPACAVWSVPPASARAARGPASPASTRASADTDAARVDPQRGALSGRLKRLRREAAAAASRSGIPFLLDRGAAFFFLGLGFGSLTLTVRSSTPAGPLGPRASIRSR